MTLGDWKIFGQLDGVLRGMRAGAAGSLLLHVPPVAASAYRPVPPPPPPRDHTTATTQRWLTSCLQLGLGCQTCCPRRTSRMHRVAWPATRVMKKGGTHTRHRHQPPLHLCWDCHTAGTAQALASRLASSAPLKTLSSCPAHQAAAAAAAAALTRVCAAARSRSTRSVTS